MQTTEQRLCRLEGQVRTCRRIGLGLVLTLVAVLTAARYQGEKKVVECDLLKTKRIVVADPSIKKGFVDIAYGKRGGLIGMADLSGKRVVVLGTSHAGAILMLGSSKGEGRIDARFQAPGDPSIAFHNRDGGEGSRIGAAELGGVLVLESTKGKGMIFGRFSKLGNGEFAVGNAAGKVVASMRAGDKGAGEVFASKADGTKGDVLKPDK